MGLRGRWVPKPVKIARRLIELYSIELPFDLDELVQKFATLHYKRIPISGVDGVTVNLKVPGKKPTVVVNTAIPTTRQRFTLAHELGHIVIPWHTGTIVDDIYTQRSLDLQYKILEEEANTFAAELLMPVAWVEALFSTNNNDLSKLHRKVVTTAKVSAQAAAIRLIQVLPPEIVFVAIEDNIIINTGRTEATTAPVPDTDNNFDENFYPLVKAHSIYHSGSVEYHWYDLNAKVELNINDDRSWSILLEGIIQDVNGNDPDKKIWMSINGIVSAANSSAKSRNPNYSIDALVIALTNRLRREGLEDFVNHENFDMFVHKRAYDFFHGIKKKMK